MAARIFARASPPTLRNASRSGRAIERAGEQGTKRTNPTFIVYNGMSRLSEQCQSEWANPRAGRPSAGQAIRRAGHPQGVACPADGLPGGWPARRLACPADGLSARDLACPATDLPGDWPARRLTCPATDLP